MYHDCSLIFRGEGIPNSRYDSIARASFNISDAFTFAPYRGACGCGNEFLFYGKAFAAAVGWDAC